MTKQCSACNQILPIDDFPYWDNGHGSKSHRNRCRLCENKIRLEGYYKKRAQKKAKATQLANLTPNHMENPLEDIVGKVCKQCNVKKPLNRFYKNPGSKDGYTGKCANCISTNTRKVRETFPKSDRTFGGTFKKTFIYLGSNIKMLRKEKGLGQRKLAEMIGLPGSPGDQAWLSGLESGRISTTVSAVEKLAEALEVDPNDLANKDLGGTIKEEEVPTATVSSDFANGLLTHLAGYEKEVIQKCINKLKELL